MGAHAVHAPQAVGKNFVTYCSIDNKPHDYVSQNKWDVLHLKNRVCLLCISSKHLMWHGENIPELLKY
jgi:hypothetical protein